MEFVTTITGPIVNVLMLPITDRLRYMMFCKKYVTDMQRKMRELEIARVDVADHMERNTRSRLEIPSQVSGWLEEVEGIKANVQNFPSGAIGCFNLNTRHKLGRDALQIIDQIESFTRQYSSITWTDCPIPLGKIDSQKASTSTPASDHRDFQSREEIFTEALKALEPNNNSHMIALWGMGGVGKTTMMQRLKKVVQDKKMFNFYVEAVIGQKTDPIAIQEAIANYLTIELKEITKSARAEKLHNWFNDNLVKGNKKLLVILDDVWQFVDLNDIGLSPLPNQGVNFKVLLTSRNKDVCIRMGVDANSIFNVEGLTEAEAQILFRQFLQTSDYVDTELHKIGEDIVRKCGGLPIAIKTIAYTLKGEGKHAWEDALARLKHRDIFDVVNEVFEISYNNLQHQESKSIFLLCGLFPEDYNIRIEDMVRYGWGLKLFSRVQTISEARNRLKTCIDRLMHKNLLMKTEVVGCVKMHDLALTFVLNMFSNVEHASIVDHGSMSRWPETNTNEFCKRISLTCKGMQDFPRDLKFPNLSILKLMHGHKSLRFPENFYEDMEKVQVISYTDMRYPLLPSSLHCSPNLRVLHLHHCSLMMFDCSSIGSLSNLEVLSFNHSRFEWLPSTIGNLEKLRLLDLTGCGGHVDKGVLQKLIRLEELYMGAGQYRKAIRLTYENYNEIAQYSESLCALEFEFYENNVQPKNMSFEKLQQFKISIGESFDIEFRKSGHSFENTLQLVTNKGEVLESRINKLFKKTEVLFLSIEDMNELGDVEVKSSHPPQPSSFQNLRVLYVSKCAELRYLFTLGVANTLSKLENLKVYSCDNMEEVVHTEDNGEETITFPKLKFLSLHGLLKLSGLCHNVNKIELPQLVELDLYGIPGFTRIYPKNKLDTSSLLKEEVVIPKLEKVHIDCMENLKEIWPCEFGASEEIKLRAIKVMNCDNLVNPFPCNFMPLLHHLEELQVEGCGSVEVLFNIALDSVVEIGKESSLRSIKVNDCDKLVSVTKKGNPMPLLYHLEELQVEKCNSMEMLFNVHLDSVGKIAEGGSSLRSIRVSKCDKLVNLFPSNPMPFIHHLEDLEVEDCGSIEVLFNVQLGETGEGSSSLRSIRVSKCDKLVNLFPSNPMPFIHHLEDLKVEDCGSIEVLFNVQLGETGEGSSSLRSIRVSKCDKLVNLFPSNPMPFIHHLEDLKVEDCGSIEVLLNVQLGETGEGSSSLRSIRVSKCDKLVNLFPSNPMPFIHHLEDLKVEDCGSIEVLFNVQLGETGEGSSSLRSIRVSKCDKLVNLFPSNPMPFIHHLEDLKVEDCGSIEVLFDIDLDSVGETEEGSSLRSIQPKRLGKLREVWRINGAHDPRHPIRGFQAVESIKIETCRRFRKVFTPITANFDLPALMDLSIIDYEENRRNDESAESNQEQAEEMEEASQVCDSTSNVVFPSCLLHSLRNLRKLVIWNYEGMEVVFEMESPRSRELATTHDNQRLLPYLEDLEIYGMKSMSHVWKCNRNKYPILQKQPLESPFENLKTIQMKRCKIIKYLFSPQMAKLLSNLKNVEIRECDGIEEVVSNRDDEDEEVSTSTSTHTSCTTLLPRLDYLTLWDLPKLRCIGGGGCANGGNNKLSLNSSTITTPFAYQFKDSEAGGVSWSLCQYPTEIEIRNCAALSSVIPWYAAGQMQKLQVLEISYCNGMKEVFETEGMKRGCDEDVNDGGIQEEEIPRLNLLLKLPNLKILVIWRCDLVEHVFPFSALESLKQLQELTVRYCYGMKVIVKEEDGEKISSSKEEVVVFPRLKTIVLQDLPEVVGFFLGMNEFRWPSLDYVRIENCPKMTAFTRGGSKAPQLKYMHTSLGKYTLGESGLNFHLPVITTTAHHDQTPLFPISYAATSQQGIPWSFHNLIEIHMRYDFQIEKIIPSNALLQLQNLEKIYVNYCAKVEEVFKAGGGNSSSSSSESQTTTTVVTLPNLREIKLEYLGSLRYIWKSNEWTVFQFPNLTRISINGCDKLQHAFSSSMVGSLLQLQELSIESCGNMEEVIVKESNDGVEEEEEESHAKTNQLIISFPRLKSLKLEELPSLKGFCLGMKEYFSFPLLDTLHIDNCRALTTFTNGHSATPELREILINYHPFYAAGKDINSFIKMSQEEVKRRRW